MQTIYEQVKDGVYSSDVIITKEEWLDILKDEAVTKCYKEAILYFFYENGHKGTCVTVSRKYGNSPNAINTYVWNFGKLVQNRLNRFQIIGVDGKTTYWPVPMKQGRDLPKGSEGVFEWTLRPELVDAIREYLMWYLVGQYKDLRKTMPIRCSVEGKSYDELYKWELITKCQGKSLIEIADSVKSTNLVDAPRINAVFKDVIAKRHDGFLVALQHLVDETVPLNARLAEFKSSMSAIIEHGFASKANDERTAATILTCYNPDKYTFYKYEGMYDNLCRYLGEEKKPTGSCYEHYLDLIRPLAEMAAKDVELQNLVSPMLEGQRKSDLLLAQDMVWMLVNWMQERMGFVGSLVWSEKKRVWLWSGDHGTANLTMLRCGSSAKTVKDFRPFKSKNALVKAYQEDVGNKDVNIPTAYWNFVHEVKQEDVVVVFKSKTEGGKRFLLLYGWGKFMSDCLFDETNADPMGRNVEWHRPFLEVPIEDKEIGNSLFFQGTTDKQAQHIIELLKIEKGHTPETMNTKLQSYIDLLKANHNLILTGAPGTGKTHLAKAIAEEMHAEAKLVQFHPSYDYTDFVEGLRPKEENGNVGFERKDGVFKAFCAKALEDYGRDFVFIIDEINRGEISKIFGELFYSIDPGYRGVKGRVDTQYQNMVEEGDVFKEGFYVPDNVYIIGTMNDIDRSVESMDFAMRRRFAWKEVTAEESMQMLEGMTEGEKLKNRMSNLNAAILKTNGLGKAYQIGAAYFLKYNPNYGFEQLWNYHLEGLLREYLRGTRNIDDEIKKLKDAYENESVQNEGTDNDNGQ